MDTIEKVYCTGHENESSAATGTQSQLKEQIESVPEQAAAQ